MLKMKSLLLLLIPTLIILPNSIVRADGIDIETGNVRVTVGGENGVTVESQPLPTNVNRGYWFNPLVNFNSWSLPWFLNYTPECRGVNQRQEIRQYSEYGNSYNHTTTTTQCK